MSILDNLSINECLPITNMFNFNGRHSNNYGNYSSKMHPILPDGVNEVTHGTLGKDKINPQKILDKLNSIIVN